MTGRTSFSLVHDPKSMMVATGGRKPSWVMQMVLYLMLLWTMLRDSSSSCAPSSYVDISYTQAGVRSILSLTTSSMLSPAYTVM